MGNNWLACDSEENAIPFSDCVLVCDSGRRFPSIKGLLTLKSCVFRDLMLSCTEVTVNGKIDGKPVEIPMKGDSEADVQLMWELLHARIELADEFDFLLKRDAVGNYQYNCKGSLARIYALARMADKYGMTGSFLFPNCSVLQHRSTVHQARACVWA